MQQRLASRGIRVVEFNFSATSIGRLAASLFNLLRDHRLDLPDDDSLLDELAHVRLVETSPGVFRLDHEAGRHDDQAIALALAAHHLQTRPRPIPVVTVEREQSVEDRDWQRLMDEAKTPGWDTFTGDLMDRPL